MKRALIALSLLAATSCALEGLDRPPEPHAVHFGAPWSSADYRELARAIDERNEALGFEWHVFVPIPPYATPSPTGDRLYDPGYEFWLLYLEQAELAAGL